MKTMMRKSSEDRGFTMVEIMVATLIAAVVLSAVAITYTGSVRGYTRNREMAQTQMRARVSLEFVAQELRNVGYLVNWDPAPSVPPLLLNPAALAAMMDPGTDAVTVSAAVGPFSGTGTRIATLNAPPVVGATDTTLNLSANNLPVPISAGTPLLVFTPPTTANVRNAANAISGSDTSIVLATTSITSGFGNGTPVLLVQQTSFWIQGGNLMMSIGTPGATPQQLAANVEDLQIVLLDNNGAVLAAPNGSERALRLSVTARSTRPVQDKTAQVPPSLEDHDRSGQPADQFLRQIDQTTVYLRNYGTLG
ncbi:MAG: prepilin-type N-terminal cleavage/methylation domain-containing protein [Nitrospirota bacterium]